MANELTAQADRVRDLIGDKHWLSDGHHKEALLIGLIERHLPSGILAGRGFVVSPQASRECSKEQDILLVHVSREAPILNQAGLIVAFPDSVVAAVSVKTMFRRDTVLDTVEGLRSLSDVVGSARNEHDVWLGSYFYEVDDPVMKDPTKGYDFISDALASAGPTDERFLPQVFATSRSLAYRVIPEFPLEGARVRGFECHGNATAAFLACLLDAVSEHRGGVGTFSEFLETTKIRVWSPANGCSLRFAARRRGKLGSRERRIARGPMPCSRGLASHRDVTSGGRLLALGS